MAIELTPETEYDKLVAALDPVAVLDFSQRRAAAVSRGVADVAHLMAVGELAGQFTDKCLGDTVGCERRYRRAVAVASGYAHHLMAEGVCFEEVVDVADEAVARVVAALTPDIRQPEPRRADELANRVGCADLVVQVVAVADIWHAAETKIKLRETGPAVATWVHYQERVLASLHAVRSSPAACYLERVRCWLSRLVEASHVRRDRRPVPAG